MVVAIPFHCSSPAQVGAYPEVAALEARSQGCSAEERHVGHRLRTVRAVPEAKIPLLLPYKETRNPANTHL